MPGAYDPTTSIADAANASAFMVPLSAGNATYAAGPMNPVIANKVKAILSRHEKLKAERAPWLPNWQLIGEYVFSRKQNFTHQIMPGQFLVGRIFDSSAPQANHLMASSMLGALWPNGANSFTITPPKTMAKALAESKEVKAYYKELAARVAAVFDSPRSGWLLALEEYMLDQGAFGISGIAVLDQSDTNSDQPVQFMAVDAKKIVIDEAPDGFVDTVYIEREMSIRQIVQQYGLHNVSAYTREAFANQRMEEKQVVLHAVEPRIDRVMGGFGNANFPIASIHIEVKTQHILKESGYHEMPVFITRFWKAMGEKYGRSPAMEAIADIMEANSMREALIIATEKMLDPPLIVNDDGTFGGATIDTSAGAIVVRRLSGRVGDVNHKPIEQMITIGEPEHTQKRIDQLHENIFNAFFIDRLLDLNNETRMTLGEAQIRNQLRGQSLGTIYSRQIAELFSRVIERVFNILLAKGMLGHPANSPQVMQMQMDGEEPLIIPDAVLKLMVSGKDAYSINFISPAARIMRSEELAGISNTLQMAAQAAVEGGLADMLDNLDVDAIIRHIQDLTGAPSDIIRDMETVAQVRDAKQKAQAAMQAMQAQHVQAQTNKSTGQAMHAAAQAGVPPLTVAPEIAQQLQQGLGLTA